MKFLHLTFEQDQFSLNWTAPFTLDITDADPDITYCVGVVNSTSSATQCGINVTEFTYPIPPRRIFCDEFEFIVIPVNVVGNGTSSSVALTQDIQCENP